MKTSLLFIMVIVFATTISTVAATTYTASEPAPAHDVLEAQSPDSSDIFGPGDEDFERDGKSKICLVPGPCYKKTLVCPKKCSEKATGTASRRLVKDHFPQQCSFNCKKCIAHC